MLSSISLVDSLIPRKTHYTERFEGFPGLCIKVLPTGTKTFLYISSKSGKRKQINLGRYPDIPLDGVVEKYNLLHRATPLATPEEPDDFLIFDAWRQYEIEIGKRTLSPKTIKQYGSLLHELSLLYPTLCVSGLTGRFVKAHLKTLRNTPAKHNRFKAALSCLCRWLVEEDRLEINPCIGQRREKETPKTRKLSKPELRAFLPELHRSHVNQTNKDILKLILLTLSRPTEVAEIHIEELDLDEKRWLLPAERSKNGRAHLIPLTKQAIDIIEPHINERRTGLLFANKYRKPVKSWSYRQSLQRLLSTLDIPSASPHDLRRTAAHHVNSLGVPSEMVGKLLNHTPVGVTGRVYIQESLFDYESDKRQILTQWAGTLKKWGLC